LSVSSGPAMKRTLNTAEGRRQAREAFNLSTLQGTVRPSTSGATNGAVNNRKLLLMMSGASRGRRPTSGIEGLARPKEGLARTGIKKSVLEEVKREAALMKKEEEGGEPEV